MKKKGKRYDELSEKCDDRMCKRFSFKGVYVWNWGLKRLSRNCFQSSEAALPLFSSFFFLFGEGLFNHVTFHAQFQLLRIAFFMRLFFLYFIKRALLNKLSICYFLSSLVSICVVQVTIKAPHFGNSFPIGFQPMWQVIGSPCSL